MEITDIKQLDFNKLYTYADYYSWKLQERVELIKGKIFKMSPAPNRRHQEISSSIHGYLFLHFLEHQCKLFHAPFDVRLPTPHTISDRSETVVQPDICVICDLEKLDERGCIGAPDLVVEILSPGNSKKEINEKFEVYQEAGVKEYWMVHPKDEMILVYVRDENGRFVGKQPLNKDMKLHSVIFPKFTLDVDKIFS